MNIDRIKKYPYWKNLKSLDPLPHQVPSPIVDCSPKGQLLTAIFAPDPLTGLPCSDLSFILSNDKNPELSQFVRDALMTPRVDHRVDDPDFAIQATKSVYESCEDFYSRLRDKVAELNTPSDSKSDDKFAELNTPSDSKSD